MIDTGIAGPDWDQRRQGELQGHAGVVSQAADAVGGTTGLMVNETFRKQCPAEARLPAVPAFATIAKQSEGAAMNGEEHLLLAEALGRANAALVLARGLLQTLGELNIIPPSHILDMQDVLALTLEEVIGDRRATPDLTVQLRETRSTTAMLDDLPLFQAARAMRRS